MHAVVMSKVSPQACPTLRMPACLLVSLPQSPILRMPACLLVSLPQSPTLRMPACPHFPSHCLKAQF
eukprot:358345-Chlamydomonas_euryale.AAC.2